MKKFIRKITLFLLPIFLFMGTILSLDIFKLFGDYENYYSENFVSLNRSMITFKLFEKQRQHTSFNAFILGSSRSQAFKCENWKNYLPSSAEPFHFDGSGEGVFGVAKKVAYLDKIGTPIEHALLVVDRTHLKNISNIDEHIAITPPTISGESNYNYYKTFFLANFDPEFLTAYFDYRINGAYKSYMRDLIRHSDFPNYCNPANGDLFYGYEQSIQSDSTGYYEQMNHRGAFTLHEQKQKRCMITTQEILHLVEIRKLFDKHQTDYKIIISPIYDQIPMEADQVALLNLIFGTENVYNFSGKNEFTSNQGYYYEVSHYRPLLANKILDLVYSR